VSHTRVSGLSECGGAICAMPLTAFLPFTSAAAATSDASRSARPRSTTLNTCRRARATFQRSAVSGSTCATRSSIICGQLAALFTGERRLKRPRPRPAEPGH
jgi:hypothetical protein